jgi:hypothetical protein
MRKGGAPVPQHVREVPPLVQEEPLELEKENVVDEISEGVVNPKYLTEF